MDILPSTDIGCVLKGNTGGGESVTTESQGGRNKFSFCSGGGFRPNADTSKIFNNGKFRLNKKRGVIEFGSGVQGKDIVVEYISDGLYTGCEGGDESEISVHKFAEHAIIAFIYYELVKGTTIPYNEKMRAKKEYWNLRRLTKMRINPLRKEDVIQALRGSSKWIK